MTKYLTPFDISNHPDLLRLAEEVNTTKTPRVLTRDKTTLAVVMPVGTTLPAKNPFAMSAIQTPFIITQNQPLIGIPFEENGQEVVRYFSEEAQADQAVSEDATQTVLQLAGAWSDLDWTEMEQELDRIRHESKPTPPIELDL